MFNDKDVQAKLRALVDMLVGYLKETNSPKTLQSHENVDGEAIVNDLGMLIPPFLCIEIKLLIFFYLLLIFR